MPIITEWFIENKVIMTTYKGTVTTDDLVQTADDILSMIDQSNSPMVHTLVNVSEIESYPTNVVQIVNSTRKAFAHPRYGWLILFGDYNKTTIFILHMVASIMRLRVRIFPTLNETIDFLQTIDSTIVLPQVECPESQVD
ncbi:MAG: hypothetical protein NZ750_00085 [Anaerolineae bacterium]|nr:hypothetical protein [Anaerolineae bacterium]MDW8171979.1 hypothetical protein [Anaerolineae bacterium]